MRLRTNSLQNAENSLQIPVYQGISVRNVAIISVGAARETTRARTRSADMSRSW